VPEPLPDFSTMSAEEELLWAVNEYGLSALLEPDPDKERDVGDGAPQPPEVRPEMEAETKTAPLQIAEVEPTQVETKPEPPPPKAWWETMVRWRQRGPEDYDFGSDGTIDGDLSWDDDDFES
jgi:hypothetical protein